MNVTKAVDCVCDSISSILSGDVHLDELTMGAYLWRQNHSDIQRMAFDEANVTKEDKDGLKTPHVSLAVRLLKRHPDRRFRLGEWIRSVP
jgi:hypothetical protein